MAVSTIRADVLRWRDTQGAVTPRSYYQEVATRLAADRSALFAIAVLVCIVGSAIAAPLLSGNDPLVGDVGMRLRPIGTVGHPLGTDEQGRDMLSRLLHGARLSLIAGILPVAVATIAGTIVGATAVYARGVLGATLMRVMDMSYAFPTILLAIAVAASLGAGVTSSMVALSIVLVPPISRVAESATRQVVVQEYMEAARISGANPVLIIIDQVLPNVFSPIFIYASSLVGLSILTASGLSFLGLGASPPTPEWGAMLNSLRPSLYVQPAVVLLPGLLIFVVSLAFNMLSNSLRDALDVRYA
jgi:peptide/nickel transport system permease protein